MPIGGRKNHRRYPGVRGRRPDLKSFRQSEAISRQTAYDALTTAEKLARLPPPPACEKQRSLLLAPKRARFPFIRLEKYSLCTRCPGVHEQSQELVPIWAPGLFFCSSQ